MARIRLALILLHLPVLPHPARRALAEVAKLLFNALSVHTRMASTMVGPREAQRAVGAGWAQAVEPIDFVHTRPSAHARVGAALIDLHFTFRSCISRAAQTFVLVDSVLALSILTGVACTVVFIDLAIHPCGSRWAVALVGIDQVDAAPSVLTGVTVALLNLDVTDGAGVSGVALAGEGSDAVFAHTVVAGLWHAVVDVLLTEPAGETFCTFTLISVGQVHTFGPV